MSFEGLGGNASVIKVLGFGTGGKGIKWKSEFVDVRFIQTQRETYRLE